MICALIQHNYDLAGKMMTQDGFHEPYRLRESSVLSSYVGIVRITSTSGISICATFVSLVSGL
jgi:homoserine kinase